ncbi:ABC transporter substrate-binding protein [Galbitalea soli]|uniref:ABC transporter substrate-binding protein n=1 Tax=Galbitalea soli TaxID=1268042 RepID=A0A7C9TR43_9MICO|nr:ABC transporter substrate-binding protein [Galbitalea soli]NEM91102.1 ABC transporter substrate-binding protein [Galbitalea soli]NYJ29790.1 branched-chain amino acid transport system substrate-binding protein [Galbitalea soli]
MKTKALVAVVALVTMSLAGCATTAGPASKAPIPVGALSDLTGAVTFPDAAAAAGAVFDEVNANGGINGHKIEYTVEDAAGDATTAAAGARKLNQAGVVANIGSTSIPDCLVNGSYYAQQKLDTIGIALPEACYHLANYAPINTGSLLGAGLSGIYAIQQLGSKSVCLIGPNLQGASESYKGSSDYMKSVVGTGFSYIGLQDLTASPVSYIVNAKQSGCETLVYAGPEQLTGAMQQAVRAQNWNVNFIGSSPAYSTALLASLGAAGEGMYAASEFAPFTANTPAVDAFVTLMKAHKVPVTNLAESGYIAAKIFVDVLKSIKGDITRESVSAALAKTTAYDNPLLAQPFVFGPGAGHQPNKSIQLVQIKGAAWVPVGDWLTAK